MGIKTTAAVVAIGMVALSVPARAATFTVQVVESGLSAEYAVLEASSAWEAGLMDALFDAGHIVSNAPVLRAEADWVLGDEDMNLAREGGADYLLLARLEYEPTEMESTAPADGAEPARVSPRRATLSLVAVTPRRLVAEKTVESLEASSSGTVDQNRARELAREMTRCLKDR